MKRYVTVNVRNCERQPPESWLTMRAALSLIIFGLILCPLRSEALTIVIDFKEAGEIEYIDANTNKVGTFDVTSYGFVDGDRPAIYDSILTELKHDYHDIPTMATDPSSPIPAGHELDIDFVIGDVGVAPSNGDSEYYYVQVGDAITSPSPTTLGQAYADGVRTETGLHYFFINTGSILASIFTDHIVDAVTALTPPDALTTGDLFYSTHAVAGTLSHEIGHLLSLEHLDVAGSLTPNSLIPLMGTGAIDLTHQHRIFDREFSYSGIDSQDGGASRTYVDQLVGAVGTRLAPVTAVPEPATIAMAAFALAGLLVLRRRR